MRVYKILAVTLLLLFIAAPAWSQSALYATDVIAEPGDMVTSDIVLINLVDVMGFEIHMDFPEAVVDTIWAEKIGRLENYGGFYFNYLDLEGHYTVALTGFPPNVIAAGSEPIIRFHMQLRDDAPFGIHPFAFHSYSVANTMGIPIPVEVTDGVIDILPPSNWPDIHLETDGHDFGLQYIGQQDDWSFPVYNQGIDPLTISQLTSSNGNFSVVVPVGEFLVAGGSFVNVTIRFTPYETGPLSSTITITSDDWDEPVLEFTVSGVGETPIPDIYVPQQQHSFGFTVQGGQSYWFMEIRNQGTAPLNVDSVVSSDPDIFAVSLVNFPRIIQPNQFVEPRIVFSPPAAQEYAATITITSDDPDENPIVVDISGEGTALAPQMNLSSGQHDFGQVPVGSQDDWSLRITSSGTDTLRITEMMAANPVFSLPALSFPIKIPPGQFRDYGVQFSPNQPIGYQGNLQITSNDINQAVRTVGLSGQGIQQDIAVNQSSHDFGVVPVNQSQLWMFSIENDGSAMLTITDVISGSGDFSITNPAFFPQTINAADNLPVTVQFLPTSTGVQADTLQILSDDPDEPAVMVFLSGEGYSPQPVIELSETTHDFGEVTLGSSITWDFEIGNSGASDLVVEAIESSNSSVFQVIGINFPLTIAVDDDPVTVTVNFSPQQVTNYSENLLIYHNDTSENPSGVSLTGRGAVAPSGMTLQMAEGSSPAGVSGQTLNMTMFNNETVTAIDFDLVVDEPPLNVTNISRIGATFSILNWSEPSPGIYHVIIAGGTAAPHPEGLDLLRLTIGVGADALADEYALQLQNVTATNSNGQPIDVAMIDGAWIVSGTPDIATTLAAYHFDDTNVNQTSTLAVFLRNQGTTALQVNDLALSQQHDVFFFETTPELPLIVAVGDSAAVHLSFTPLAGQVYTTDLQVGSNDPDESPYNVTLIGQGFAPQPVINLSSMIIEFGQTRVGSTLNGSFLVSNTGDGTLEFDSAPTLDQAAFILTSPSQFPFTINPGNQHTFELEFTPPSTGFIQGTMVMTHNDADQSPSSVILRGTGLLEDIELPSGCDVGDVPIGDNDFCQFSLCNAGTYLLTISNIVSDNDAFEIINFPTSLNPQDCQNVTIRFSPESVGEAAAEITIFSSDPDESESMVTITGNGIGGDLVPSTFQIDFGNVAFMDSQQYNLTLSNPGNAPLVVNGFSSQQTLGLFSLSITNVAFPLTIPAAGSEELVFTLTALSEGDIQGTLTFFHDGASGLPVVIGLEAFGYRCTTALSAGSHDFGDIPVGQASAAWSVTLYNHCPVEDLVVENISISNEAYTHSLTNLPHIVAADDSVIVTVIFQPLTPGAFPAELTVELGDWAGTDLSIGLDGTGLSGMISPASLAHDFGPVPVDTASLWQFSLTNTGNASIHLSVQDDFTSSDFLLVTDVTFPLNLEPTESWTASVSFSPTIANTYVDSLVFGTDNPEQSLISLRVWGEGVAAFPEIYIHPDDQTHDFELVEPGENEFWSFYIYNIGESNLHINSLTVNQPEFSYIVFSATIGAGDSTLATIYFEPDENTPDSVSDTLHIWSNDPAANPYPILLYAQTVGIDDPEAQEFNQFLLYQNHPNPFTEQTKIAFQIPFQTRVRLTIYNSAGQEVRHLADQVVSPGRYEFYWDGTGDNGQKVPAGVFFYRLATSDFVRSNRLVFLSN